MGNPRSQKAGLPVEDVGCAVPRGPGCIPWIPRKVPTSPGCLLDAAVPAAAEPGCRRSLRPANRAAPRVPFPSVLARSPDLGLAWLPARLCHPELQLGCCGQARAESAPGAAWAWGGSPPGEGGPQCLWVCRSTHLLGHLLLPFSSLFLLDALGSLLCRGTCTHFKYFSMPSPFPAPTNLAQTL